MVSAPRDVVWTARVEHEQVPVAAIAVEVTDTTLALPVPVPATPPALGTVAAAMATRAWLPHRVR